MRKNNFLVLTCSTLLAFCLFSGFLNAQSIRYGVQVATGISGILEQHTHFPEYIKVSSRSFSYGVAATAEKTFKNPRFGLLAEPGFSKKGYTLSGFTIPSNTNVNLYYLHAPLSLYYQPFKNDRLRVGLGGEMGYLLADRLNGEKYFQEDFHNKFDLAGHISVQTTLFSKFALGIKASRSFLPLSSIDYTNDTGERLGTSDWINYNLHFYARYYIN